VGVAQRHHRSRPWNIDEARALFESRGCTLLEHEYVGYRHKMLYRCPGGHEHAQGFDSFAAGHGCPRCSHERRWADRRIDLDDVRVMLESEGLTGVEVARVAGRITLGYTCRLAHRSRTSYQHFIKGQRCRRCASANSRGPSHPNYNHGLTDEVRRDTRKYREYDSWRRAVFARDEYACRRCGSGGRLNAHHIVGYRAAPHLRLDIPNGITLCVACHRGFHSAHGYHHRDSAQLKRFLENRA
jgi:5-methylcytosine-specific restriction endonuclease McrA